MAELPLSQYADPALVKTLLAELRSVLPRPLRLMEVCGTHTMALFETGLRPLLAGLGVELLSGPGCPVCVTAQADIDRTLALAALPGVTLCTFGDMLRVPGTRASLAEQKAAGADVRVVYSPLDAVEVARELPTRTVVFLGVGFETTAPGIAFAAKEAMAAGLGNFRVLPCLKLIPPALMLLAADPELRLDGFICPGHVSVVIGEQAYAPVCKSSGKPCVIAGFEPVDLAQAVLWLVRQVARGEARVENAYSRVVRPEGNPAALRLISEVFEPADAEWRGLGVIPGSGLKLRPEYAALDATSLLPEGSRMPDAVEPAACRCGEVLAGRIVPPDCASFGTVCTPDRPLGACMVSQEGACRAYYRYGGLGVRA